MSFAVPFKTSSKPANILDRSLSRGKTEANFALFALLFSEIVQYSQNRVGTVADLHKKLASLGSFVGSKLLDVIVLREKGYKREVKLLSMLMFVKTNLFKNLFGKEADKLERNSENPSVYYIIEREPLVNTFISVPKDKGSLNCAAFVGGIVESVLSLSNFPCKVSTVWHNGTTYVIEFDDVVMRREK
ncbi:unnamed protein product [Soboliphyme baturini]|uniref:Trafficking protein particle complex subunit 5 n=1 Tax=Soboliphyme baturini TaxID=241478 RepID=A0A183IYQ4_9BILA|nr:unnamed protein product [Soboliphyme baturini]